MVKQIETGTSGHRRWWRGGWIRPVVLVAGMVLSMVVAGPAVPAQAVTCGNAIMATGVHYTHDGWLSLYLRETPCTDYNRFSLVVHNLSSFNIGNRSYALTTCNGVVNNYWLWGAYIPAGGVMVSPEEPGMDKYGAPATVAGIIYYPYSGSGLREPDTYTGCVR